MVDLPERLRYARDRAGLTGPQVEQRTGIGRSSLSEFEHGKREPSLSQLHALAQAYRRSIAFFLADEPVREEVVLWREAPAAGREEITRTFLRLCEQYHNLEVWLDEAAALSLPAESGDAGRFTYARAKSLAKRVRDDLQLGERPALCLLQVLEESCGVKVFHLDFEPAGAAACARSESYGAGVLLNARNVRWRRNFDLAHELFHLITWDVFRSPAQDAAVSAVAGEQEEKLANCFASSLLIPPESLRGAVDARMSEDGRVRFRDLFDIARQFDVSVDALLWQAHYVCRRGPGDADRTQRDIERAKAFAAVFEQRTDTRPTELPELPARYSALAVRALRQGEMSIGRFAEYLGISRREAMKYAEREVMDDEEVEIPPA